MGSRNKRDRQTLRRQSEELAAHNELDAIMRVAMGESLHDGEDDGVFDMPIDSEDPLYDDEEEELRHQLLHVETRNDRGRR